jgi:hypothetical protein
MYFPSSSEKTVRRINGRIPEDEAEDDEVNEVDLGTLFNDEEFDLGLGELEFGNGDDNGDIFDDDDDDDDDDEELDEEYCQEVLDVALDSASALTDARVIFKRDPRKPDRLLMVAVIEDILPNDFDDSGDEMWEAEMIIRLGDGYAGAIKEPKMPNSAVFNKKNWLDEA